MVERKQSDAVRQEDAALDVLPRRGGVLVEHLVGHQQLFPAGSDCQTAHIMAGQLVVRDESAGGDVHDCQTSTEGVCDGDARTPGQRALLSRREGQANDTPNTQRNGTRPRRQRCQIDDLYTSRPERSDGCTRAVFLDGNADRVRPDRQASADLQPSAIGQEGDELVALLIHDQDVPTVGEDSEVGQALSDDQLLANSFLVEIHKRYAAGAAVGHT